MLILSIKLVGDFYIKTNKKDCLMQPFGRLFAIINF